MIQQKLQVFQGFTRIPTEEESSGPQKSPIHSLIQRTYNNCRYPGFSEGCSAKSMKQKEGTDLLLQHPGMHLCDCIGQHNQ